MISRETITETLIQDRRYNLKEDNVIIEFVDEFIFSNNSGTSSHLIEGLCFGSYPTVSKSNGSEQGFCPLVNS